MVWIHGGSFTAGSGGSPSNDATAIAEAGEVVVVAPNYRLGALGFLAVGGLRGTDTDHVANFGLLDQLAALEWVQAEIAAFGGDPTNVTLFGCSAGAMCIASLLAAPAAKGLFHRAIIQSTADRPAMRPTSAGRTTTAFLEHLGVDADLEDLRQLPVSRLQEASEYIELEGAATGLRFGTVADGIVVPTDPIEAIAQGASANVDVLIGSNRDEFQTFASQLSGFGELTKDDLGKRIGRMVPGTRSDGMSLAQTAIAAYTEARVSRGETVVPSALYSAIMSDRMFRNPAIQIAEIRARRNERTFMYLFEAVHPRVELGACHGLESLFLFGSVRALPGYEAIHKTAPRICSQMQIAWASFARNGIPTVDRAGPWPEYDNDRRATMMIGSSPRIQNDPLPEERRFWIDEAL